MPSGYHYPFDSIDIKPMYFAQILEYIENVPKDPVEKYYFDYCIMKEKDPLIDQLLVIDYEYSLYMMKAVTVSENLEFNTSVKCPRCGETIRYKVSLASITYNKLDSEALAGFQVLFGGQYQTVRMPTISQFMTIFSKYRAYKKISDLRIIRLISLFEQSLMYLQRIESQVINATYDDIGVLMMLDSIYFNFIKPYKIICNTCVKNYMPSESEIEKAKEKFGVPQDQELPNELLDTIKMEGGVIEVRLEDLVSNFFRDLYDNNRVTSEKILPRQVREDTEH